MQAQLVANVGEINLGNFQFLGQIHGFLKGVMWRVLFVSKRIQDKDLTALDFFFGVLTHEIGIRDITQWSQPKTQDGKFEVHDR